MRGAEWVRTEEGALKEGMTVRGRAGLTVTVPVMLLRRVTSVGHLPSAYRGKCRAAWAWITSAMPNPMCWCKVLGSGGHIERLRDLDDAEEEGRRIATDIDDRRRAGLDVGFPLFGRAR